MSAVITNAFSVSTARPVETTSPKLLRCGLASLLIYVLIAVIFWTEAVFERTFTIQILLYASLGALTLLYFLAIPLVRKASLRLVLGFGIAIAVVGFLTSPFDSTDVFYYMAQGWLQSHYGNNPYASVLRDIPDSQNDSMIYNRWMELNRNPWLDEPMPYGFGFALLARIITWLGHGHWWATFILFRLLNFSMHIAIGYLLWKTAVFIPGADSKLVMYLYAWSPLVVLQYLANLHNDIIMGALILLSFSLLCRKRPTWILSVLVLAGFVKYAAFALVPLACILILRQYGTRATVKSVALAILTAGAVSQPYIWDAHGFKFHDVVSQLSESRGSIHAFMMYPLELVFSTVSPIVHIDLGLVSRICRRILWLIVIIAGIRDLRRAWMCQVSTPKEIAICWTSILFALMFIGSSQFYAWYIGMIFPLSLLCVGTNTVSDILVLFSGTHMVGFTFLRHNHFAYFLLATAMPALLVLWWRRRSRETPITLRRAV
jgi:hypothetical protein